MGFHYRNYNPTSNAKPSYVVTLTNKYVYEILPPGILEELKMKIPINISKNT